MPSSSAKAIVLHGHGADGLVYVAAEPFPAGLFCASPTVLEAVNLIRYREGMPVLWVQADGTAGPADPLLLRMEYVPSPFVM